MKLFKRPGYTPAYKTNKWPILVHKQTNNGDSRVINEHALTTLICYKLITPTER